MVGINAVYFFRIIQRPQTVPHLGMADRNMKLYRGQRGSYRLIRIAVNQQLIRLFLEHIFNGHKHFPYHLSVASAGNAQVIVGFWDAQLFIENIGHIVVIILTGMNKHLFGGLAKLAGNNGCFDKLRSCANGR